MPKRHAPRFARSPIRRSSARYCGHRNSWSPERSELMHTSELTHKAPGQRGIHKSRIETETKVADGENLHAILLALGLKPCFRYEKFRAEWSDGRGHVVIDQTPIGNLAEIEGEPDWIERTAKEMGVTREQYITQNYADLFRDWKKRTRSPAEEMTFAATGTKSE